MHYQNLLCIGDSQTFGARTYGCYPLYLARILTEHTPYQWRTINRSVNGYTARDLWFLLNNEIEIVSDTYQACILIGTNDVGNETPLDLFEEYYRQIIRTFLIKKYKAVFCGEIPPIYPDGHIFFCKETAEKRNLYNAAIMKVTEENRNIVWVPFNELSRNCYVDSVHFNELGNRLVAESFTQAILAR
ncbi:SGNH/GDSL hydrolase family protein [Nitrosomonas sp.]|uniref:SGNH/GDSL hydrolase family protein n=1 Tax=Nitrosomonas sp. TaxID=42353 RepID=UPI0025FDF46D|nr:SGNH/GDSL hydrolase family protein [Nitrosomonas sp.]MBY0483114.1 SGNH/GDSL hydrolase family protein [Nitrosomonas sp.]